MTVSDEPRRTAVYRLYDEDDTLLYIGIAYNVESRWGQHSKVQPWWDLVVTRRVKWYPTRTEAEDVERDAIKAEGPRYNKTYGDPEYLFSDEELLWLEHYRRRAIMINLPDGTRMQENTIDGPKLIAPGTYLITLDYDPAAHPDDGHVTLTECVLLHTEDEFTREWGARDQLPPKPY